MAIGKSPQSRAFCFSRPDLTYGNSVLQDVYRKRESLRQLA